jgi:hypothetical protein
MVFRQARLNSLSLWERDGGEGDVDARTSCFRIILMMLNLKCCASGPTLSQREMEFLIFFNGLKITGWQADARTFRIYSGTFNMNVVQTRSNSSEAHWE